MRSNERNNERIISEEIINTVFAGIDHIKALVEDIKADGEENTDISNYLLILDKGLNDEISDDKGTDISAPSAKGKGFGKFAEKILLSEEEEERVYNNLSNDESVYNIEVKLS